MSVGKKIREYLSERHFLEREFSEVNTRLGAVRVKESVGFGTQKIKPEYDDIAKIALETGLSFQDVLKEVERQFRVPHSQPKTEAVKLKIRKSVNKSV